METRTRVFALTALAAVGTSIIASADDLSSGKDLTATIVLNGQPCDQVVTVKRRADSDYDATCRDGNHYHVYINDKGRVVVDKL